MDSNYWNEEDDENIICPYCGKEYEPSYEDTYIGDDCVDCYTEDTNTYTCDKCGKKFTMYGYQAGWKYHTETIDGEATKEEIDDLLQEEEKMENRYLFKAKRKDNGEWMVGFYTYIYKKHYIYTGQLIRGGLYDIAERFEVDPSTICRCTGLKDKNDKLIWENDIVKFDTYCYEKLESSTISQIKWCNDLCALSLVVDNRGTRGTLGHLMDLNKEVEVLGNIFDSPELLESEE